MALGLREECKKSLIQELIENLEHVLVDNNVHLNFNSMRNLKNLDARLPQTGTIHTKLINYIGENPLYTFIYETINREVDEKGVYDSKSKRIPLNSLPDYSNLRGVAERLINEFANLPLEYVISFELPTSIGKQLCQGINHVYKMDDTHRLITVDEGYIKEFPLTSGIKGRDSNLFGSYWIIDNIGGSKNRQWNKETLCMQFDVKGFIGRYTSTTPILEVIAALKAFLGFSIALNFIEVENIRFVRPRVKHLIVHHRLNEKWEIWDTHKLPMDLAEVLDLIKIKDMKGQDPSAGDKETSIGWLSLAGLIFRFATDKAKRLYLACQWLCDSYSGDNELLSLVQTMAAIEVMLGVGEYDDISLGALLRNRCAYLIGKTQEERELILKEFRKIYQVRSKILHRGQSKLNKGESIMFFKLQNYCSRIILEELKLVCQDMKSGKKS